MNSRVTASPLSVRARHPRSHGERPLAARAAYAELAGVVVFFAFHVYWHLGGSSGLGGELPGVVPDSVAAW